MATQPRQRAGVAAAAEAAGGAAGGTAAAKLASPPVRCCPPGRHLGATHLPLQTLLVAPYSHQGLCALLSFHLQLQGSGEPPKARLRGAMHHYAAFVALAIGIMLILEAQSPRARLGCIIYTLRCAAAGPLRRFFACLSARPPASLPGLPVCTKLPRWGSSFAYPPACLPSRS